MVSKMANFVRVGDSPHVINLEQVAYVNTDVSDMYDNTPLEGTIEIRFEGGGAILLSGDNAERFMNMLERQTGVW